MRIKQSFHFLKNMFYWTIDAKRKIYEKLNPDNIENIRGLIDAQTFYIIKLYTKNISNFDVTSVIDFCIAGNWITLRKMFRK